jgi:hypothetical protein
MGEGAVQDFVLIALIGGAYDSSPKGASPYGPGASIPAIQAGRDT